jgi:putative peptide zinc metalloprotease protein
VPPLVRGTSSLRRAAQLQPNIGWICAVRLLAAIGLVAAILFVPFNRPVSSMGVTEWADTRIIRAECPGFIESVFTADNDSVQGGQLLVELRNDEALSDLAAAQDAFNGQLLRTRISYARAEVGAYQAEYARAKALETMYKDQLRYVSTLHVRAPQTGRVSNRLLSNSKGKFIRTGEEILRLGRSDGYDVKIAVSQPLEPHFRTALQKEVIVRVVGRPKLYRGRLVRVEAKANREIYHPALTALAGGPLAVRQTDAPDPKNDSHELAEPHFMATARIETSDSLQPGEIAKVTFWSQERSTLWQETQRQVTRWIRDLIEKRTEISAGPGK